LHFSDIFEYIKRNAITRSVTSLKLMQGSAGTDSWPVIYKKNSTRHTKNVKATAFSPRWMENKMPFQNVLPNRLRLLYQTEKY